MDIFQAALLGAIQGLTEFLPVSSSGHLVVFQRVLGVPIHSLGFDVVLHIATLFSIFTYYVPQLFRQHHGDASPGLLAYWKRFCLLIFVASLPTAVIGFLGQGFFTSLFSSLRSVAVGFFITGVLLQLASRMDRSDVEWRGKSMIPLSSLSLGKAFLIGLAQGLAIAPGVSRAGTTISTGLFLRVDKQLAALFSFAISVPAIIGAAGLELLTSHENIQIPMVTYVVGFITAYFAGLLGLWGVLHVLKRGKLVYFSLYLWALATFILMGDF